MFVTASTGRTGTQALCVGLDRFSDHHVEHEPSPPLRAAWRKHQGEPYADDDFHKRMSAVPAADARYGMSWRAPNLLTELRAQAPDHRLLIVVRHPLEYVVSAHRKGVLSRGDEWDQMRLMPHDVDLDDAPVAERIAWHWVVINRYLLQHAADPHTMVATLQPLAQVIEPWADHLGVTITDHEALLTYFADRPNKAPSDSEPEGYDPRRLMDICEPTWAAVLQAAGESR